MTKIIVITIALMLSAPTWAQQPGADEVLESAQELYTAPNTNCLPGPAITSELFEMIKESERCFDVSVTCEEIVIKPVPCPDKTIED